MTDETLTPRRMMAIDGCVIVQRGEDADCLHLRHGHDENLSCTMEEHGCKPIEPMTDVQAHTDEATCTICDETKADHSTYLINGVELLYVCPGQAEDLDTFTEKDD